MPSHASELMDDTSSRSPIGTITSVVTVLSGMALLAGVVIYAVHNLGNTYFWTDESSTFMSALGWPGIGGEPGALGDAWSWIMRTFLDPGVFHVLVRFWSLSVGTEIYLLRFLPFIFFLIYLAAIILLSRLMRLPWLWEFAVVGLMMLENITLYYAVELRPYAAGLAADVALPLVALWLIARPSPPRLVVFIIVFLAVGTMQYDALPIELAVALVLVVAFASTPQADGRIYNLIAAAVATLWLPIFYLLTRGNPLQVDEGEALDYIPDLVLADMPADRFIQTLFTNLFSATALPRTLFIILVPIVWLIARKNQRAIQSAVPRNTGLLWLFVTTATLASFALASLGFIPWLVGSRWSIADVGLIAVSLVGLLSLVADKSWMRSTRVAAIGAVASVVAVGLGTVKLVTYERQPGFELRPLLEQFVQATPGRAVIDVWLYPEVRYWIEYSDRYADLSTDWNRLEVVQAGGFDEASIADVLSFLDSEGEVFLLRSEKTLRGVPPMLLSDYEVLRAEVSTQQLHDAPVVVMRVRREVPSS